MKLKLLILVVAVALVLPVMGCNGVQLSPVYSKLLDESAAISEATAKRAEDGLLSEAEKTEALRRQANVWQKFRDARDGRAGP